jgi:hypothetical protein
MTAVEATADIEHSLSGFLHPEMADTPFAAVGVAEQARGGSGHRAFDASSLLLTDIVAKVENRTTPKISRKRIFRQLDRCNAL